MTQNHAVTVAIIQHPPVFLNLAASIDKACTLIKETARQGAQLIVFPETWLPGYPVWFDYAPNAVLWNHPPAKALYTLLAANALTLPSPELEQLREVASQTGSVVVLGVHERAGNTLYNTIVYLQGDDVTIHRKLMPTYTERLVWGRGDGSTLSVIDTDFGRLGGLVCWEHWMPLARAAMHAKHEVVHVAQWPAVKDLHQLASRHYAFEGQCFVLAAGCVLTKGDVLAGFESLNQPDSPARELLEAMPGENDTLLLNGGSALIAPSSDYLSEPLFGKADIIYGEIDPARIAEGHLTIDTDGHYARPDVFQLLVNETPQTNVTFKGSPT